MADVNIKEVEGGEVTSLNDNDGFEVDPGSVASTWIKWSSIKTLLATWLNTLSATWSNKTLTAPTIADFTNAAHDHGDADDGGTLVAAAIAGLVSTFWTTVPGTPTRVSDTQFTITDTGNANLYDKLFVKGVILRWLESTTFQTAMVISSSYAANAVTINIVGDSLTAGFTSMKYALSKALRFEFIVPGALGAVTDVARTHYPECDIYKLSVDARVKTAGTTNATVFDVNDDGTTIITTKPSIASAALTDLDNVCDNPSTVIAANSILTLDIDSVSTTPPVEAYVDLWYYPEWWRYLT